MCRKQQHVWLLLLLLLLLNRWWVKWCCLWLPLQG
jgi:hypothetical protein